MKSQRGIALMLVLWVLGLLTLIALGLTATQRTETELVSNQIEGARFRALADAAINYTALNLLATPPLDTAVDADLWTPDGQPRTFDFNGQPLEITLNDESSYIDLNSASREVLAGLFEAMGIPLEEADALADAVIDWRDEDDLVGLNGAEDGEYASAGLSYGAKDAPFETIDELELVLGFDRDLVTRLRPALTVDSESDSVELTYASPLVQAAVQGISIEDAIAEQELERQRREELFEELGQRPVERGGPRYRLTIRRPGSRSAVQALILTEPGASPPVKVLWRRYGLGVSDHDMMDPYETGETP